MRNRFDRQLEMLNQMLIHMGELCETAIEEVTGALEENDMGRAKAVITADEEIDQMEKDIENLCLKLLLQQQPVARSAADIGGAQDDYGYGANRRSNGRYCRYCYFSGV